MCGDDREGARIFDGEWEDFDGGVEQQEYPLVCGEHGQGRPRSAVGLSVDTFTQRGNDKGLV